MSREVRLDAMAPTLSSVSGNWERTVWSEYKSQLYGKSFSPNPDCTLFIGQYPGNEFYSYINRDCINAHPFDFLHSAWPVLQHIGDNFQRAADSFLYFLPTLRFNNKSIFLAATSGNMSVVLKLDVEVLFKCLESLTQKALQYDVRDGKFTASVEKVYNGIFNNVTVDLGNFGNATPSFGLKFHTLGLDYSISCKPVAVTGLVNIFEASGTLKKTVTMDIDNREFAIDISSGYEAVIEVHKNMPSAPLLPIPRLVNALSSNQVHVKPVTVDNLNISSNNVFSANQTVHDELRVSPRKYHESSNNNVVTFSWWNRFKTMAEMGTICLVGNLIINNNHNSGTLNTRVNSSFGETTLSTMITSVGFGVMVYLGRGMLLSGL